MNMKVKVWGKVVVMERADHPFVTVESLIRDTIPCIILEGNGAGGQYFCEVNLSDL